MISGFLRPSAGDIRFQGRSLRGLKPHQVAAEGIARTFQTVELFGAMTVLENVMLGCYLKSRTGLLGAAFRLRGGVREEVEVSARALSILEMVGACGACGRKSSQLATWRPETIGSGQGPRRNHNFCCWMNRPPV